MRGGFQDRKRSADDCFAGYRRKGQAGIGARHGAPTCNVLNSFEECPIDRGRKVYRRFIGSNERTASNGHNAVCRGLQGYGGC